jgi:hypothetical protein
MKTFIDQSLIDKGDPLALAMLADGAKVSRMVPVKDWVYYIFKVKYAHNEDMTSVIKSGYLIGTENHIELDVERNSPCDDCWFTYELFKKVPYKPRYNSFCKTFSEILDFYN